MTEKRKITYRTLARELRVAIQDGKYSPGEKIPGELELSEIHNVSRTTARLAIKELENQSLVYRRQGSGTFVSTTPSSPAYTRSTFTQYLQNLDANFSRKILEMKWTEPTPEIAATLRIPVDSVMLFFHRLDLLDGSPMAYDRGWIAGPYAHRLGKEDLKCADFYEGWQRKQGFKTNGGSIEIAAAAAKEEQAELLKIKIGEPVLLELGWIFHDDQGVAHFETYYRHDKYRFRSSQFPQRTN